MDCRSSYSPMAVGVLRRIKHCWATFLHLFIFLNTIKHLFQHFQARFTRFQFCIISKVKIRLLWFFQLSCASCRSWNVGYAELWSSWFHAILKKLCWFECWLMKLSLLDLFDMIRIRLNQCCIVDVWCKTDRMVYVWWTSVRFGSWSWWTRDELAWILGFCVSRNILICLAVFCMLLVVCLPCTNHSAPPHLMKRSVSLSERSIEIARRFEPGPKHSHILLLHLFNYALHVHVHFIHHFYFFYPY